VIACDRCGRSISPASGFLVVDEVTAAREAALGHVGTVLWRVYHRGCDPDPSAGYDVPLDRALTADGRADLRAKRWLSATDWPDMVHRLDVAATPSGVGG
jgi:hypothetical protein